MVLPPQSSAQLPGNTRICERSIPTNSLPSRSATAFVVPLPQNGSMTVPPTGNWEQDECLQRVAVVNHSSSSPFTRSTNLQLSSSIISLPRAAEMVSGIRKKVLAAFTFHGNDHASSQNFFIASGCITYLAGFVDIIWSIFCGSSC